MFRKTILAAVVTAFVLPPFAVAVLFLESPQALANTDNCQDCYGTYDCIHQKMIYVAIELEEIQDEIDYYDAQEQATQIAITEALANGDPTGQLLTNLEYYRVQEKIKQQEYDLKEQYLEGLNYAIGCVATL